VNRRGAFDQRQPASALAARPSETALSAELRDRRRRGASVVFGERDSEKYDMPIARTLSPREVLESTYREESRRIFASLVRMVRDFDLAEEAMQEAFAEAVESWERDGIPQNPRAWLVSSARFKAIDTIRRQARFDRKKAELVDRWEGVARTNSAREGGEIEDDRLRVIFTCCHPAIDRTVQVPLVLREVCGLTTEDIASAFLTATATMAQRIVRGKAKIRDARIPFTIPEANEFPERLASVLTVIYLVFNEGYSASSGHEIVRAELASEAIRLGRLLVELLPEPEAIGLLALMLLQDSRRAARVSASGDLVLLEEQDRSLWDHSQIEEGEALVERALASGSAGAYAVQAAIASVHAGAPTAADTDWAQITALYDALLAIHPSPVVELNRAVAVAMRDGAEAALPLIDAILERGELGDYHLAYAARAELCRRSGRIDQAKAAFERALQLAKQEPERRFLRSRLAGL
jgi:RNA polymerase sigma-70 factor (ECF subfamily)